MKIITSTFFLFCFLGLWTISADNNSVDALPRIISSDWDKTDIIGHTSLRKFGFHIYDASYWNLEKGYDANSTTSTALMIVYARDIDVGKLLNSTRKQWEDIGISEEYQTEVWLEELGNIWPSVTKGDVLIALVEPEGPTKFYSGHSMLGEMEDPKFGRAFLDIWLSSKTNYKKNRKELLNEQ